MDFGGGWTDVPPYSEREGGVVCAVAIARYATARLANSDAYRQRSPRSGPGVNRATSTLRKGGAAERAESSLVRAALARVDLHAAPHVQLRSDFPIGAGLGGSSAASAALLGALDRCRGVAVDRRTIAERGREIEVEDLGVPGGRQDHYCAAYGGALGLRIGLNVDVTRIPLSAGLRAEIERRCMLVYTGESRISGDTITGVLEAYLRGDAGVTFALARMRELAVQMIAALERADVDALASLVDEHWAHQRALHPAIPTPRIDAIVERARAAGATGAKAMGASGGGCVLAIARSGAEDAVRRAVGTMGELIPFTLDEEGLAECDWNAETP